MTRYVRTLALLIAFPLFTFPSGGWAQTLIIPPGATASPEELDRTVPELARRLLNDQPAELATPHLLDPVRLALAAGLPGEAIRRLDELRGNPKAPPVADQPERAVLEMVARAREREGAGRSSAGAHEAAFREVMASLTDLEAYEVTWYLETPHFVRLVQVSVNDTEPAFIFLDLFSMPIGIGVARDGGTAAETGLRRRGHSKAR